MTETEIQISNYLMSTVSLFGSFIKYLFFLKLWYNLKLTEKGCVKDCCVRKLEDLKDI